MLRDKHIRAAYRALLGREPESKQIIKHQISEHKDLEGLLSAIIRSPEFRLKSDTFGVDKFGFSNGRIDIEVSQDLLSILLERTTSQWTALGEQDPYWSVISDKKFRISNFETHSDDFWNSGIFVLNEIDNVVHQYGVSIDYSTAIELGCGVGRLTRFLATRFESTIAMDISPGNLEICRAKTVDTKGLVLPTLIQNPHDLSNIPEFNLFVSYIVLQHNPPPIQFFMLDRILSRLKTGGLAMFQVPTMGVNYSFIPQEYLSKEVAEMDMHVLPLEAVMKVFNQNDMTCIDIRRDFHAGPAMRSNTFIAVKN
jgi:SAM-dependent methyltransferase